MYTSLYPVTYYFYPLLEAPRSENEPEASVRQRYATAAPAGTPALLYIHIPYCHDLCRFCPFHVRADNDEAAYANYTRVLCREMRVIAALPRTKSLQFSAVYFGGGSPSILPPACLDTIFKTLSESFSLTADVEISFEGEPRTLGDPERLNVLKKWNTQRISFGLQTYDPQLRELFNIAATLDDVERARSLAREFRFDEVNVDMMYGLPGQTLRQLNHDVARLLEDGFDSVDYYSLHYFAFPKKFLERMSAGEIPAKPSETMTLAFSEQLRVRLVAAGYNNVADQIYSKKAAVCEYFRLLWGGGYGEHRAETVAVGSSARGFVDGQVYMNHSNVQRYLDAVESERLPVEKTSSVLREPASRGAVFFSKFFRLEKRFDTAIRSIDEATFQQWIENGYIYDDGDAWALSERGKPWTNNITFDAFAPNQRDIAGAAVVSLPKKAGIRTGSF